MAKKHYSSPPQRAGGWSAERPGETVDAGDQTVGALGSHGPDQGYAMTLTSLFNTKIALTEGEHRADVDAGCVALALKRASLFGRAPIVHDLRIAYTLFGFLDEAAPADLIEYRRNLFAEVHYSFHYFERRAIADLVDDDILSKTPDQVAIGYRAAWRQQLND